MHLCFQQFHHLYTALLFKMKLIPHRQRLKVGLTFAHEICFPYHSLVNFSSELRIQRSLFIYVVMMTKSMMGWILRDFIYWVAIVDRDGWMMGWVGRNRRKMEPELVPEWSVWPVDGCVAFYIMSQVWIQVSIGNIPEDQYYGLSSTFQDIM